MLKLLDTTISWLEDRQKNHTEAVQKQAFRTSQKTQHILSQEIEKRKAEIREVRELKDMLRHAHPQHQHQHQYERNR